MKNEKEKINHLLMEREETVKAYNYYKQRMRKGDNGHKDSYRKDCEELMRDISVYDKVLEILGIRVPDDVDKERIN